jgi:hypothetical protein
MMSAIQGQPGCRPRRNDGGTTRSAAILEAGRCTTVIVVIVFALLTVLSVGILVMTDGDAPSSRNPRDNPLLWTIFGGR